MARNLDKHPPKDGLTRRQRLEQERAAERRADRRRTWLIVGTASVLAVALVLGVILAVHVSEASKAVNQDVASFGVAAAAAGCDPVVTKTATASQVHVGPGTDTPDQTFVSYSTVPPMFGPHFAIWAPTDRHFYTERDRPQVENLVHNLEHGYTVVWYDSTITGDQLDALKGLSEKLPAQGDTKFIVTSWDTKHGEFPAGKHVAVSHWGAKDGAMQLCAKVSGPAIQAFVDAHPFTDSPEPQGM